MSTNVEQQIQSCTQAVYAKASADPVFRQLCLSDAKAAIKVATGLEMPAWVKVRFVDGNDAHFTFVLPDTKAASGELMDEDLEQVSGGAQKDPLFMHGEESWTKGSPGDKGNPGDKGDS
jgi:hypothetical protein